MEFSMTKPVSFRVTSDHVWKLSYVIGMGKDEQTIEHGKNITRPYPLYYDMVEVTNTIKSMQGEIATGNWHVQPYSWDFTTNSPRTDFTPLAGAISLWEWDGTTARIDTLWAFEIGNSDSYECVLQQGDKYVQWHFNNWIIDKEHFHTVLNTALTHTAKTTLWNRLNYIMKYL